MSHAVPLPSLAVLSATGVGAGAAGAGAGAGGAMAATGGGVMGSAGTASALSGTSGPTVKADQEFLEVNSVSLEWKLGNLKTLFDSSKGDLKSKCVKSSFFGGGKWQVFFYPNSGHDQYCSLYLSCQPTPEECEKGVLTAGLSNAASSGSALAGKVTDPTQVPWAREGLFKFTFEIKSTDRKYTFKAMEATDHAFSHEARNWGWAQYWRRNDAYYNNQQAKYHDSFLICCTIVYSPSAPSPPPPLTRRMVPNDLLDAYASLFDDPDNSDVRFKIVKKRRHPLTGQRVRIEYSIFASRKILGRRSEYFGTMFESGFREGRNGGSPDLLGSSKTSNNIDGASAATMLQTSSGNGGENVALASPGPSPKRRAADASRRATTGVAAGVIEDDALLEDSEDDEDSDSILGLGLGAGSDASTSFDGTRVVGDQTWSETEDDEDDDDEGEGDGSSIDLDMLDGEDDGPDGVSVKGDHDVDGDSSSDMVGDSLVPRSASTPSHNNAHRKRGPTVEREENSLSSDAGPQTLAKLGSPTPRAGSALPSARNSIPLGDNVEPGTAHGDEATTRVTSVPAPSQTSRGHTPGAVETARHSRSATHETPFQVARDKGVPSSNLAGRRTPDDDVRMVGVSEDEAMFDAHSGLVGVRRGDVPGDDEVEHGRRREAVSAKASKKAAAASTGVIRRDKASLAAARKKAQKEKEVLVVRGDKRKRGNDGGRGGEEAGRWRAEVTVTDASYHTFRALLYYLYTDSITFAPLASTYLCARDAASSAGVPFPFPTRKEFVKVTMARIPSVPGQPQGPGPCSAKAIYRLADKIGLPELKARAFEHIVRSLTPQNIPMEVFSSFTSAYEEVRRVEIEYMLRSWNDVRDGPAMRLVLSSLRDGRLFPGFADVWRLLLANLEYRPKTDDAASADAATAGQEGAH